MPKEIVIRWYRCVVWKLMEIITYSRMYCKRDFVQTADNLLQIFNIVSLEHLLSTRADKGKIMYTLKKAIPNNWWLTFLSKSWKKRSTDQIGKEINCASYYCKACNAKDIFCDLTWPPTTHKPLISIFYWHFKICLANENV